jgi:hypothetical protein
MALSEVQAHTGQGPFENTVLMAIPSDDFVVMVDDRNLDRHRFEHASNNLFIHSFEHDGLPKSDFGQVAVSLSFNTTMESFNIVQGSAQIKIR